MVVNWCIRNIHLEFETVFIVGKELIIFRFRCPSRRQWKSEQERWTMYMGYGIEHNQVASRVDSSRFISAQKFLLNKWLWPPHDQINWLFLCKSIFLFTIYIIISDYILIIMDIIHLYIDQATLFLTNFSFAGGKSICWFNFFLVFNFDFSIGEHSPWRNNLFRNHKITTKMICFPMCLPACPRVQFQTMDAHSMNLVFYTLF